MEVPAVLAGALEEQRRDPVVVLAGRLAVHDGPGDDDVRVPVAHAPERGEDDVHVELQRAAAVVEQAVEPLGVLRLRDAVALLRRVGEAAGALDEERRKQPQARVADAALVVRKPARAGGALGRGGSAVPVGPDLRVHLRRHRERVAQAGRSPARCGAAARGLRRRPLAAWASCLWGSGAVSCRGRRPMPCACAAVAVASRPQTTAHRTSQPRTPHAGSPPERLARGAYLRRGARCARPPRRPPGRGRRAPGCAPRGPSPGRRRRRAPTRPG